MTRIERIQTELKTREWDAYLVHRPDEIRYLTGARGTLVKLLISPTQAVFISHYIDMEQTHLESPGLKRVQTSGLDGIAETIGLLSDWGAKNVAFSRARVGAEYFLALEQHLNQAGITLVDDLGVIHTMRMIKDQEEQDLIRQATKINDAAYNHILPMIKPGVTEMKLAIETRHFMWQSGVEDIRFLVIQSGPHSALPHIYPTDRVLQPGDFVLMDWVPVYEGYSSDVTRTVVIGEPTEKQRIVYGLVQKAQAAGLRNAKPGMTGDQVDAAARRLIEAGGYGDCFGHSLGHGINEGPNLDIGSSDVLQPGMVATVEPGIYIPGWGGVRIEDTVIIHQDGAEALPQTSKELVVLDF